MTRKRPLMIALGLVMVLLVAVVLVRGPARRGGSIASGEASSGDSAGRDRFGSLDDGTWALTEEELLACAIEGTVEDEGGSTVAGALVTARRARSGSPFRGGSSQRADADEDGVFRVEVECGDHRVTATAPGLVSPRAEEVEVTEVATVRLVLSRNGHSLSGVVTDRSGGAVPMAVVRAQHFPAGGTYSVATDGDGRYRLLLPLATYWVEASAADYAAARRRLVVNRERNADFELDPAGTIRGRVVLYDTGEPVPGAQVRGRMGRRWRGHVGTAKTDGSGEFDLTGLAPGEYDVEASRGPLRGRYSGHVPVNVASYTPDIVIRVKPGLSIRGFVRDDAGAGIADASVQWFVGRGRGRSEESLSRADGSFVITGLESGRGVVFAQHDDYVSAAERLTVADQDVEVELVLAAGARIRGIVVNQSGRAVTGALVSASGAESGGRRGRMRMMMMQSGARDITDTDGKFLLEGIGGGDVAIRAQHLEGGLASHSLEDVVPGREYNVRMVMAQGATVSGTVTWVDGQPAAGATVHAFSRALGPMGAAEAEVSETGAYSLEGLDATAYTLWALRPGNESAMPFPTADSPQREVELEPTQQLVDIDFQLPLADQSIAGSVVDEAGAPVADAQVGADAATASTRGFRFMHSSGTTTRSSSDGTFLLEDLVSGTYQVWAELPGFPRADVNEVVASATGVLIRLPAGAVLAGKAVGPDDAPVTGYRLRTIPSYESAGWSRWHGADRLTIEDPEGSFEVRGLRAGSYRLVMTTSSGQLGELEVEVGEGERRDGLLLRASGGTALSGTLTGHPSGTNVCGNLFVITDGGRKQPTCEDGRFEVEGLASGEAMLMARVDETMFVRDRFTLILAEGENEVALRFVEVAGLASGAATPGVVVQPLMGRFVVSAAVGESIAAGDELVTIDGVTLTGFGPHGVEALLRGPAGSTVALDLVAVSGEAYSVSLTRSE